MRLDSDILKLIAIFGVAFAVLTLVGNPINFEGFPQNVSPYSWVGLALLIVGLVSFWYGTK